MEEFGLKEICLMALALIALFDILYIIILLKYGRRNKNGRKRK